MAVYYKFKSAKDYDLIRIDGHFISVASLKLSIIESKRLRSQRRGNDFDLIVSNAQTNEEYLNEAMLIPKNTSVLVQRVPLLRRLPIVIQPEKPKVENQFEDDQSAESNITTVDSSSFLDFGSSKLNVDFGSSIYDPFPERTPEQSNNALEDSVSSIKAEKDNKIMSLVENSGYDWQQHDTDGFGPGRGFGRGGQGGRRFDQSGVELKTPPQGYVCHICKVPGHFIQHCPTYGDPNYDINKVRPLTGVPKSMLLPTEDGSYEFPSDTVAVLNPYEAAFGKMTEGISSSCVLRDFPPELRCPLCKVVMKDAVLSSKCCFGSFCDKCIRDHIISKSMCVCGARGILADYLVPNKTLRDTINRFLECPSNSIADNQGSSLQFQDRESARCRRLRTPSPTQSVVSNGEQMLPPDAKETPNLEEHVELCKTSDAPQPQVQPQISGEEKISKVPDIDEATLESLVVKGLALPCSSPVLAEVQQKVAANEAGEKKKKKRRKMSLPVNGMQWMSMQPSMDGYMHPSASNHCQSGMQPAVDGFTGHFGGTMPSNMGYGLGSMDMPFDMYKSSYFFGSQGFMMPEILPLQRDFIMNMNFRSPVMSNEEFEARSEVRRKQEKKRVGRDLPKDSDFGREASSRATALPMKSKHATPAHRSPREEIYHCHDGNHDSERENKRGYLGHYRDHGSHHRISRSHPSTHHDSGDSYSPRHPSRGNLNDLS